MEWAVKIPSAAPAIIPPTIHANHFEGACDMNSIPNITRKIMPAVDRFSVAISPNTNKVSPMTILKERFEAPFSVRIEERRNAATPTRLILASSEGWKLKIPTSNHRAPPLILPAKSTKTSITRETRSITTLNSLNHTQGIK